MKIEKIMDEVKKPPGVSYVLMAITYLGARSTGVEELAGAPLVVAWAICGLGYWIGSMLDRPVYDNLYGPKSRYNWLPKHTELCDTRDELAKALFHPKGIHTYKEAFDRGLINDKKTLYNIAKNAAEGAKAWEGFISRAHDFSKAARSLFVISIVMFIVLLCLSAFPDSVPSLLAQPIHRLGFWSNSVVYACLIPVFLFAYIYLRVLHQSRLYKYVSANVKLLAMPSGELVPVIPEFTV